MAETRDGTAHVFCDGARYPTEDTSDGSSSISRETRRGISTSLHSAQLIDVWRLFHPGEKDYSFFSKPHQSYSRIDFLIPHRHLHAVKGSTIGSITWSDHTLITLQYDISETRGSQRRPWRLNESLLHDTEAMAEVVTELGHYFVTNSTADCSPATVWEAHKAVVRGILIKHGARLK